MRDAAPAPAASGEVVSQFLKPCKDSLFHYVPYLGNITTCLDTLNIRGPFRGHQAVRNMFQVYNSHSFNQSFANFKVHSTSNFKVYSIKISFQSSCNLFLCFYRATRQMRYPPFGVLSQTGVSPGIPENVIELSLLFSSICGPKMNLKTVSKSP